MATTWPWQEDRSKRADRQSDIGVYLVRYYTIPVGKTFSDFDLEQADPLHEDASALIQNCEHVVDKIGAAHWVKVTAFKPTAQSFS